jgi:hypothetical protein
LPVEAHQQRLKASGRKHMKTRVSLAEHSFGTLKNDMGWQHFLRRGLEKVRAERDLQVLCYNFNHVLNLVGISAFKTHLKQRAMAYLNL